MDTYTLEKILRRLAREYRNKTHKKVIYGVYPADYLIQTKIQNKKKQDISSCDHCKHRRKLQTGRSLASIVYTCGRSQQQKETKKMFFFDSYGRPPTSQYIREYIKSVSELTKWNTQQLQAYDSLYCGEWCCVFLACVLKGIKQKEFYDHFSTKRTMKK